MPQSTAATRVMQSSGSTQDPLRHHSGRAASASSPSGLAPGPSASGVGHQHVQALDPVRHAARGHAGDLRHRLDRLAGGEVALVSRPVGRGQVGVRPEPLSHLPHGAAGLEGADRPRRLRAGEVVERRERRAVREPRRGLDHVRRPAGTAVRHATYASRRTAELSADGVEVRGVDLVGHRQPLPGRRPAASTLCHRSANHGARSTSARTLGTTPSSEGSSSAPSTTYDVSPGIT